MKALFAAFDFLPGFQWALLLAGALAFGGMQYVRMVDGRTALAEYKASAAESARLAVRASLAELQRITTAQGKAIDDATKQTLAAQDQRRAADDAAEQLRKQVARLLASIRTATDGTTAGAGGQGQQSGDALDMLVNVLDRHHRELVAVGEYADRLRIAGQLCERSYDALVPLDPGN